MEGWRAKTLSQVGKMVLIKAMAAVVPSYAMSTFLLPKSFCRKLDQMFQKLMVGFPSRENPKTYLSNPKTLFALQRPWEV
jgi:hypothetical protein